MIKKMRYLSLIPGNNSPDRDKGMGIGLSICQTIIEAHNGEIHADTHDEGSVFYFSLPKED